MGIALYHAFGSSETNPRIPLKSQKKRGKDRYFIVFDRRRTVPVDLFVGLVIGLVGNELRGAPTTN